MGGDYSREAIILNIFIKRGRLFEEYGSSEGISNIEQPHFCEKEKERNLLYPVIPWGEGGNSQGTQQPYNN